MNKIKQWFKRLFCQDIIIVENCKNSKITINGKVVFDDIKNTNFKGWFTVNNQVNNYNKNE